MILLLKLNRDRNVPPIPLNIDVPPERLYNAKMINAKSSPHWYKKIFAWLMANGTAEYENKIRDRKQSLFTDLHGTILEIGAGTGANAPYYPPIFAGLVLNPIHLCTLISKKTPRN